MSSNINYKFIGWCVDEEKNHDKVWVAIQTAGDRWGGKYITCWGRRGRKLQTKMVECSNWEIEKLINSKVDKGYETVNKKKLDEVYPEFERDLSKVAVWGILKS